VKIDELSRDESRFYWTK